MIALVAAFAFQATQGQALLDESARKLKKVGSALLTCTLGVGPVSQRMTARILRGGYFWIKSEGFEKVKNAGGAWTLMPQTKQYMRLTPDSGADNFPGFEALFDGAPTPKASGKPVAATFAHRKTLKVPLVREGNFAQGQSFLYLDVATHLPVGIDAGLPTGQRLALTYLEVKLNVSMKPAKFDWTPPSDWKEFKTG